ncbi:sulfate adenylyltransferase subunit CysN [Marinospirillum sp. MEB164]|uniref:Sulfate adenylyltransferase subunit 1 n=1 Tax=Marinospirillum alkalitolerans TaxID=3123374 RepID=A0ABW8PX34_9GAMM
MQALDAQPTQQPVYQQQGADLIAQDIQAYLKQHENKQLLRLLTCGSVDDGKSTLIGRLLHDSKMIYEDQLEALQQESKTQGTTGDAVDLALLVDGLQAEREQGITIDVAYRYFSTTHRKFIIADTPGHEQYTRNMATGASNCELAIILMDARKGVLTQTRRHSFIVSLLGIRHLVVAINKMDLVDYSQQVFEQIKRDYLAFAESLDLPEVHFVPLSALKGDNVVSPSSAMPWYSGPALMPLLESVDVAPEEIHQPLRFPVQYVNRPHLNFRGYCGTVASGQVQVGDTLRVLPSGRTSRVQSIVTWEGELAQASAAMAITLTLEDELDISRGDLLVSATEEVEVTDQLDADLVWMAEQPLVQGKTYLLKIGTRQINARISRIHYQTDVNSLEQHPAQQLELNAIAHVSLDLEQPVVADAYRHNRATGRFILIDRLNKNTLAAGMVATSTRQNQISTEAVQASERSAFYGTQAGQILLHGGDANARLALAQQLERALFERGKLTLRLEEGQLPEGLATHQTQLEHWLIHQGLLLLTTCASDAAELQVQLIQATGQLELPNQLSPLLQALKQHQII